MSNPIKQTKRASPPVYSHPISCKNCGDRMGKVLTKPDQSSVDDSNGTYYICYRCASKSELYTKEKKKNRSAEQATRSPVEKSLIENESHKRKFHAEEQLTANKAGNEEEKENHTFKVEELTFDTEKRMAEFELEGGFSLANEDLQERKETTEQDLRNPARKPLIENESDKREFDSEKQLTPNTASKEEEEKNHNFEHGESLFDTQKKLTEIELEGCPSLADDDLQKLEEAVLLQTKHIETQKEELLLRQKRHDQEMKMIHEKQAAKRTAWEADMERQRQELEQRKRNEELLLFSGKIHEQEMTEGGFSLADDDLQKLEEAVLLLTKHMEIEKEQLLLRQKRYDQEMKMIHEKQAAKRAAWEADMERQRQELEQRKRNEEQLLFSRKMHEQEMEIFHAKEAAKRTAWEIDMKRSRQEQEQILKMRDLEMQLEERKLHNKWQEQELNIGRQLMVRKAEIEVGTARLAFEAEEQKFQIQKQINELELERRAKKIQHTDELTLLSLEHDKIMKQNERRVLEVKKGEIEQSKLKQRMLQQEMELSKQQREQTMVLRKKAHDHEREPNESERQWKESHETKTAEQGMKLERENLKAKKDMDEKFQSKVTSTFEITKADGSVLKIRETSAKSDIIEMITNQILGLQSQPTLDRANTKES